MGEVRDPFSPMPSSDKDKRKAANLKICGFM